MNEINVSRSLTISSSFLKVCIFKLTEIFYLHLLFGKKGVFGIIVLPDASVYTHLHIYVYIYMYVCMYIWLPLWLTL